MPLADLAVLLTLGLSTPALGWLLWQRGVRGRRLLTTVWVGFYGLVLTIAMTAHCVDILGRLYLGQDHEGAAVVYDFRLYSLILLGAVLIGGGVRLLGAALEISRGDAGARAGAARATLMVLAVVAPLIPIQPVFAAPLAVLGALTLLVLAGAGGGPEQPVPAPPLPERDPAPASVSR